MSQTKCKCDKLIIGYFHTLASNLVFGFPLFITCKIRWLFKFVPPLICCPRHVPMLPVHKFGTGSQKPFPLPQFVIFKYLCEVFFRILRDYCTNTRRNEQISISRAEMSLGARSPPPTEINANVDDPRRGYLLYFWYAGPNQAFPRFPARFLMKRILHRRVDGRDGRWSSNSKSD